MEPTVVYRDPFELRPHRLQRLLPDPDKKGAEWPAFVDAMQAAGADGIPAIFITPDAQIMDGGWRWRAAKELEWPAIKCEVQPEERAGVLVVETLLHRKQMTRGAVVYLALRFEEDFVQSAESRRLANLRRGTKTREIPLKSPKDSNCPSETILEICRRWGIHQNTYKRARQVLELFTKNPALRKELEPELLSGEKNLWNILSAAGGADADQTLREFGVLKKLFKPLATYSAHWKKLTKTQRDELMQQWRSDAAEMPQDLRESVAEALLEEANA